MRTYALLPSGAEGPGTYAAAAASPSPASRLLWPTPLPTASQPSPESAWEDDARSRRANPGLPRPTACLCPGSPYTIRGALGTSLPFVHPPATASNHLDQEPWRCAP